MRFGSGASLLCAGCVVAQTEAAFSKTQLRKGEARNCKQCVDRKEARLSGGVRSKWASPSVTSRVHEPHVVREKITGQGIGTASPDHVSNTQDFDSDSSFANGNGNGAKVVPSGQTPFTYEGHSLEECLSVMREQNATDALKALSKTMKNSLDEQKLVRFLVNFIEKHLCWNRAKSSELERSKAMVFGPSLPNGKDNIPVSSGPQKKPEVEDDSLLRKRAQILLKVLYPDKMKQEKKYQRYEGQFGNLVTKLEKKLRKKQGRSDEGDVKLNQKPEKKGSRKREYDFQTSHGSLKKKHKATVCDKCDGTHETEACPHYRKARENHPDAQRRKAIEMGSSGGNVFLRDWEARVHRMPGDGSCLYHSLFEGLKGRGASSPHALRQDLARWVLENANARIADSTVREWVRWDSNSSVEAYSRRMRSYSWGGGIEMAAFSRLHKLSVHVYEGCRGGYKRISCFEPPGKHRSGKAVSVLYSGGIHFDSLKVHRRPPFSPKFKQKQKMFKSQQKRMFH